MDKKLIRAYIEKYMGKGDCFSEWGALTYQDARIASRWLHRYRWSVSRYVYNK